MEWDELFLEAAELFSKKSKDTTKIGCVLVRDNRPICVGFNGIPSGVEDRPERLERPEKYKWICHSETNAIANAAKFGIALDGSTLYVTGHPCNECAKMIIGAGIKEVKYGPRIFNKDFDFHISKQMFEEAGIKVVQLNNGETNV